ncbi:hypothetical protein LCGC14_0562000 [marine sediment metagenome]|uniref:Uncharacterized protein n=1 Tax=marine sediment metagenome TaxID=412755 RepID=A0A0F9UV15_9ZZZZ
MGKPLERHFKLIEAMACLAALVSPVILIAAVFTWITAKRAIEDATPFIVWAVAGGIVIAVLITVPVLAIWLGGWSMTRTAQGRRDRSLLQNEARQSGIESDRMQMRTDAEWGLINAALKQLDHGLIHPTTLGEGAKFDHFPATIISKQENEVPLLEAPPRRLEFEPVARKALSSRGSGRFIGFGAMDTGKTTLAKHMVDLAKQEIVQKRDGRVFILDPHAPKTVWGGDDVTIIGAGLDYGSIRGFLDQMQSDIKKRYEAGCGDDSTPLPSPPCFVICEEWSGVLAELQAKKQWGPDDNRMLYMDSRKAGWGYFLVSHEHTVGSLGLQGMGNLLAGVEYFITLEKDAITGEHSAILGKSFKDKDPYELITPGAYNGRMYYSDTQARSEMTKTEKYLVLEPAPEPEVTIDELAFIEAEPTDKEQEIIDAAQSSRNAKGKIVMMRVTGLLGWSATGPNNERIKAVLDKWDIDY